MKNKWIRLFSGMLILAFAVGLLPAAASAAELQAKDVAAAYLSVLNSATESNFVKKQVRFYDVCGDAAPEMIVAAPVPDTGECMANLRIWTYQNGTAKKLLEYEFGFLVAGGGDAWVYLLPDGRIGVFYRVPDWGIECQGTYYQISSDGSYVKTDYFQYTDGPSSTGEGHYFSGSINGKTATEAQIKAEEKKLRAGTVVFDYRSHKDDDETERMTIPEAKTFLKSIKGRFWDVPSDAFYTNAVNWALQKEITGGVDEINFGPDRTVMRADAMVFFWAAKDRPAPTITESPFKDVKKKHWYYDAVLWAVENGISGGTDATHFSPKQTCSRSEILQFLYAAEGKPAYVIDNPYSDLKPKHWYYDGAIWAYEKGLEKGENGKFNAKTPCTRGYVVTYLYRYVTGNDPV